MILRLCARFNNVRLSQTGNQRRRTGRGAQMVGPGWRAFRGDSTNARHRKHGLRAISSFDYTVSILTSFCTVNR